MFILNENEIMYHLDKKHWRTKKICGNTTTFLNFGAVTVLPHFFRHIDTALAQRRKAGRWFCLRGRGGTLLRLLRTAGCSCCCDNGRFAGAGRQQGVTGQVGNVAGRAEQAQCLVHLKYHTTIRWLNRTEKRDCVTWWHADQSYKYQLQTKRAGKMYY